MLESAFGSGPFFLTLRLAKAGSEVEVSGWELDPDTSEAEEWTMTEHQVGSTIERVAMRHANEWFVALRLPSGEVAVERWTLEHTTGAYWSSRPAAPSGIGTAVATPEAEVGIEGDVFVVPSGRPRPGVTRTRVVGALALGPIESMAVDPDGRYLVMVVESCESSRAVQVPLVGARSPAIAVGDLIPLWDFSSTPGLAHPTSIVQLEHAASGWRALEFRDVGTCVYLWDAENDGIFERHEFVGYSEEPPRYPYETWSRSW